LRHNRPVRSLTRTDFLHFPRVLFALFQYSRADNAIGVSYQLLGADYYGDALQYHERHAASPDLHDQFIAHTNMGLIYAGCGNASEAAVHHQHALRFAIRVGSVAAQSVAIGNLGLTGTKQNDLVTAKACMERYLELSSALQDARALGSAHASLGLIAAHEGEQQLQQQQQGQSSTSSSSLDSGSGAGAAVQHFHLALRTAQAIGDRQLAATSKVNLGVALGNTMMEAHMRKMAGVLTAARGSDPRAPPTDEEDEDDAPVGERY
jgi:hypothetical protein